VTRAFLLVVGTTFSAFVTIGILLPALPLYAKDRLDAGDVGVGLAVGAASITAFLAQPLAGRLADRRGRRLLMIGGALIMVAASLGYLAADNLAPLVALRLLSGIGEAAVLVAAATTVTDMAPAERRGEALSLFTFACYGGLAAGPPLGGWLAQDDRFTAVWLAAATTAAAGAILATRVPETRPNVGPETVRSNRFFASSGLLPGVALLMALFGFGGFNAFVALYAEELGLHRVGLVFLVFALVVMTIRSVGRQIPDRLGAPRCAALALTLLATGLATVALWPSLTGLFVGVVVFSCGQALAFPAMLMLAVQHAPAAERSAAVGTVTAFVDLALASGALTLGVVAEVAGYRGAFATASAVAAAGLLLLPRLAHARARAPEATPEMATP
jgi:MFS family permease